MQGQMDLHQKINSLGMFGLVQVCFQIYDFSLGEDRSEGFPRMAYFIPGRDGKGGGCHFRNCSIGAVGGGVVHDKYLKNT